MHLTPGQSLGPSPNAPGRDKERRLILGRADQKFFEVKEVRVVRDPATNTIVTDSGTMMTMNATKILSYARAHATQEEEEDKNSKGSPDLGFLSYRDLRQILLDFRRLPTIEARRGMLVFCFPPLAALVLRKRTLVFVDPEFFLLDTLIVEISRNVAECFEESHYPYAVLEALTTVVLDDLTYRLRRLEDRFNSLRKNLSTRRQLHSSVAALEPLKNQLQAYNDVITGFDKSLDYFVINPSPSLPFGPLDPASEAGGGGGGGKH
eukprot:GHVU01082678.1.p1 GENE.GHVU01082678.1~~GHVU01082678.1.p1  ORF type:complete len:264 (+),score=62.74 GHVU01082678.1:106-897(+)